jgi:hypothetical protein
VTPTYHIRKAKYVRFYDGFVGQRTIYVLKGLDISGALVVRMPAVFLNNNRTMNIKSVERNMKESVCLSIWAAEIGAHIAAGKNMMVFYSSRRKIDNDRACIKS